MKLIKKNSPNHYVGRGGWKADMIVFHQTGGNTLAPALNYYLYGQGCSPNFLIDTDGTIYQLVDPDNAAWCNGTNKIMGDKLWYGYSLSELVKERKTNANYFTYSAEFVHCQWGNITPEQVTAAVELITDIIIPHMKKNGVTPIIDRKHIVGHSDISPKTRDPDRMNCPGKRFPYDEIIEKVITKISGKTLVIKDNTAVNLIAVSNGQVAIRMGPDKSASIYSRAIKGNYYIFDKQLTCNGKIWLKHANKEWYSMKIDDGVELFTIKGNYKTYTTTTRINVRIAPSTQSNKLGVLERNTLVYAFDENSIKANGYEWIKIIYDGRIGYLAGEYLK